MSMVTVEQLVDLLVLALREPLRRKEIVAKFQAKVWEGLDPTLSPNVRDVLRDLAYDLDFFEMPRDVRSEDATLYGHKRLEREILDAFAKLKAAGVTIPRH
jgi:hypothetical protein